MNVKSTQPLVAAGDWHTFVRLNTSILVGCCAIEVAFDRFESGHIFR